MSACVAAVLWPSGHEEFLPAGGFVVLVLLVLAGGLVLGHDQNISDSVPERVPSLIFACVARALQDAVRACML